MKMDFDTGCLLKYQIYCFRYLYLSKFFVEQLCKSLFAGPGQMLVHKTCLRHPLCTEHKPRRTVLAVCMADLYFRSRGSHPKCVLVILVVCNKVLCVAERAVQACSPSQSLSMVVRERWDSSSSWAGRYCTGLPTLCSYRDIWKNKSWANSL